MDLSIIVPVHNEAGNIAPMVAEIRASLTGRLDYEIVYVDDGSTDKTAAALAAVMSDDPRIRVLAHRARAGQSRALRTGIQRARADVVAIIDGDLQNPPAALVPMWDRMAPDGTPRLDRVICGWRRHRRDRWTRRLAARLANIVQSRMLGARVPDWGCGIKMFGRDAFLDLPHFDHMHRFLPALFAHQRREIISMPVAHRPRQWGASKYRIWPRLRSGVRDVLGVRWLGRRSTCAGETVTKPTLRENPHV